jgi:hypothetical protein
MTLKKKFDYKPFLFGLTSSLIPIFAMLIYLKYEPSSKIEDWASLGEYISGTVGTIISIITIILVVRSIDLQTTEFNSMQESQERTIKLLYEQNSESTFFNLLNLHHRIAENIAVVINSKNCQGRDVFKNLVDVCADRWYDEAEGLSEYERTKAIKALLYEYNEPLKHYVKNVRNTISMITRIDDNNMKNIQLETYKSQFSNSELIIIGYIGAFYNSNLKALIVENKFLSELDFELDLGSYTSNDTLAPSAIYALLSEYVEKL